MLFIYTPDGKRWGLWDFGEFEKYNYSNFREEEEGNKVSEDEEEDSYVTPGDHDMWET